MSLETASDQVSNLDPEHAPCSLCQDRSSSVYYCETCESSDSSEQDSAQASHTWLCDGCVISHIKQGHQIKNEKQQEPLICEQHKKLESEYCRTCDISFCSGCLTKHSEHKFDSLKARATELKTQVFILLNEMEKCEKPLRKKQERVNNLIKGHQDKQTVSRETLLAEIDKLKEFCLSIFYENGTLLEDDSRKTSQAIEKVVDLQQKLRDLLNCTHAHLVKDFAKVNKKAKSQLGQSEELTMDDSQIDSVQTEKIEDIFKYFRSSIETQIKSTKFYEASTHYVCNLSFADLFKISAGDGMLRLQRSTPDKATSNSSMTKVEEVKFKLAIDKVYSIHPNDDHALVLFLTKDKQSFFSVLPFEQFVLFPMTYPTQEHLLWPYYTETDSAGGHKEVNEDDRIKSGIRWSYWDGEKRRIRFTHNNDFNIECPEPPSVQMSNSDCNHIAFITGNNLILVQIQDCSFETLPLNETINIDCVSYGSRWLILWSRQQKTTYFINKNLPRWTRPKALPWNQSHQTVKLLPVVKDFDGTTHFVYSFKFT